MENSTTEKFKEIDKSIYCLELQIWHLRKKLDPEMKDEPPIPPPPDPPGNP